MSKSSSKSRRVQNSSIPNLKLVRKTTEKDVKAFEMFDTQLHFTKTLPGNLNMAKKFKKEVNAEDYDTTTRITNKYLDSSVSEMVKSIHQSPSSNSKNITFQDNGSNLHIKTEIAIKNSEGRGGGVSKRSYSSPMKMSQTLLKPQLATLTNPFSTARSINSRHSRHSKLSRNSRSSFKGSNNLN